MSVLLTSSFPQSVECCKLKIQIRHNYMKLSLKRFFLKPEENSYINNKVLQKDLQRYMWDSVKNLWWSFLIKIVNGVYPKQARMM